MRIDKHPILDEQAEAKSVTIYVDGNAVQAREGEMVAAALMAFAKLRLNTGRAEYSAP